LHSRVERIRCVAAKLKNPLKPLQKTCGLYSIAVSLANENLTKSCDQSCDIGYNNLPNMTSRRVLSVLSAARRLRSTRLLQATARSRSCFISDALAALCLSSNVRRLP